MDQSLVALYVNNSPYSEQNSLEKSACSLHRRIHYITQQEQPAGVLFLKALINQPLWLRTFSCLLLNDTREELEKWKSLGVKSMRIFLKLKANMQILCSETIHYTVWHCLACFWVILCNDWMDIYLVNAWGFLGAKLMNISYLLDFS